MTAVERVKEYLRKLPFKLEVILFDACTHTSGLAAQALGVQEAQIAKTLVFVGKNKAILVVASGDKRVDAKKLKSITGEKMKFANQEQVELFTGFPPGGVCPFDVNQNLGILIDISLKRFEVVYAAAGTPNSAVPVTVPQLLEATGGCQVDVCS